ncbi:hypothetical protein [Halomonas sp. BN3-1]|uniref:hypothetical protein n=1 Tax=Halomonas sp. BN3-1 TaxID=2082393 RepID=UPI000D37A5ED|nr:hypothetical protein [Halomonas sp. BN3-1]
MITKNDVIAVLFVSTTLSLGLYLSARSDIQDLEQAGQRMFQLLSEDQKKELLDQWETRQSLFGNY